jgi:hypothetical protein
MGNQESDPSKEHDEKKDDCVVAHDRFS